MNKERRKILDSKYWSMALNHIDPHFNAGSNIFLSDHLLKVESAVIELFYGNSKYSLEVLKFLNKNEINIEQLIFNLRITSLLHDIGRIISEIEKTVPTYKIHAFYSREITLKIFNKTDNVILNLIFEHDTPYFLYSKKISSSQIFEDLNNKVSPDKNFGIILLMLFKLVDTHGHRKISDVIWFLEEGNKKFLQPKFGKSFPIPTERDIRELLPMTDYEFINLKK